MLLILLQDLVVGKETGQKLSGLKIRKKLSKLVLFKHQ